MKPINIETGAIQTHLNISVCRNLLITYSILVTDKNYSLGFIQYNHATKKLQIKTSTCLTLDELTLSTVTELTIMLYSFFKNWASYFR